LLVNETFTSVWWFLAYGGLLVVMKASYETLVLESPLLGWIHYICLQSACFSPQPWELDQAVDFSLGK